VRIGGHQIWKGHREVPCQRVTVSSATISQRSPSDFGAYQLPPGRAFARQRGHGCGQRHVKSRTQ
jgi:hypothetical protein